MLCKGKETFVSPFIARFVANVGQGIARSLKTPPSFSRLRFDLDAGSARLEVDGAPVELQDGQGFAETIVRGTLRGMIQNLKGIDPDGSVQVEIDLGEERGEFPGG